MCIRVNLWDVALSKGLSRWVRTRLGHHTDFTAAISSLKRFVEERITHDSDTM